MPRVAATYSDPKAGWQLNGSAIYAFNFENEAANYHSGDFTKADWKDLPQLPDAII
jgi:hypothetical protein